MRNGRMKGWKVEGRVCGCRQGRMHLRKEGIKSEDDVVSELLEKRRVKKKNDGWREQQ